MHKCTCAQVYFFDRPFFRQFCRPFLANHSPRSGLARSLTFRRQQAARVDAERKQREHRSAGHIVGLESIQIRAGLLLDPPRHGAAVLLLRLELVLEIADGLLHARQFTARLPRLLFLVIAERLLQTVARVLQPIDLRLVPLLRHVQVVQREGPESLVPAVASVSK